MPLQKARLENAFAGSKIHSLVKRSFLICMFALPEVFLDEYIFGRTGVVLCM